jgi:hypothetical protein
MLLRDTNKSCLIRSNISLFEPKQVHRSKVYSSNLEWMKVSNMNSLYNQL